MNITINIDTSAGFCWGVVKTIDKVEQTLLSNPSKKVYVLGEIIHNPHEIKRLNSIHLSTITIDELCNLSPADSIIVIRAHGEPPLTYSKIAALGIDLVDATCPLVKRLQNKILECYQAGKQIVIFGKTNHAEVIGLRGCCNDKCIVCLEINDIIGKIDFAQETVLFSQTTMNVHDFVFIATQLKETFKSNSIVAASDDTFVKIENTVCKFMVNREAKLKQFAKQNDWILFVAGHHSSNGKVLFDICKSENAQTIFIEDLDNLDLAVRAQLSSILSSGSSKSIGITGATSTPMWLMKDIATRISSGSY